MIVTKELEVSNYCNLYEYAELVAVDNSLNAGVHVWQRSDVHHQSLVSSVKIVHFI